MNQLSDSYALYNQPIVIDNGSGIIKAGFSGEERPKALEYSLVGHTKYDKVMLEGLQGDTFVGNNAQRLRGLLKLRYPIKHGVVEDWDSMELIWSYVLNDVLQLQNIEEHPLLITEAPMNPLKNREAMAQVLFETFNAVSYTHLDVYKRQGYRKPWIFIASRKHQASWKRNLCGSEVLL